MPHRWRLFEALLSRTFSGFRVYVSGQESPQPYKGFVRIISGLFQRFIGVFDSGYISEAFICDDSTSCVCNVIFEKPSQGGDM